MPAPGFEDRRIAGRALPPPAPGAPDSRVREPLGERTSLLDLGLQHPSLPRDRGVCESLRSLPEVTSSLPLGFWKLWNPGPPCHTRPYLGDSGIGAPGAPGRDSSGGLQQHLPLGTPRPRTLDLNSLRILESQSPKFTTLSPGSEPPWGPRVTVHTRRTPDPGARSSPGGASCATQPCPREPGDSACPNPALGSGVATELATAQL